MNISYVHNKVAIILSMITNTMFIHGYIPQPLVDTVLIPIVRDKKGNVMDRDSYRPVAVICIISKIL